MWRGFGADLRVQHLCPCWAACEDSGHHPDVLDHENPLALILSAPFRGLALRSVSLFLEISVFHCFGSFPVISPHPRQARRNLAPSPAVLPLLQAPMSLRIRCLESVLGTDCPPCLLKDVLLNACHGSFHVSSSAGRRSSRGFVDGVHVYPQLTSNKGGEGGPHPVSCKALRPERSVRKKKFCFSTATLLLPEGFQPSVCPTDFRLAGPHGCRSQIFFFNIYMARVSPPLFPFASPSAHWLIPSALLPPYGMKHGSSHLLNSCGELRHWSAYPSSLSSSLQKAGDSLFQPGLDQERTTGSWTSVWGVGGGGLLWMAAPTRTAELGWSRETFPRTRAGRCFQKGDMCVADNQLGTHAFPSSTSSTKARRLLVLA